MNNQLSEYISVVEFYYPNRLVLLFKGIFFLKFYKTLKKSKCIRKASETKLQWSPKGLMKLMVMAHVHLNQDGNFIKVPIIGIFLWINLLI